MCNIEGSYNKIPPALLQLNHQNHIHKQIRTPKLSDIEIFALVLTAEHLNIDSERKLFRRLPEQHSSFIKRSVYHRRKKRLFFYIELLRSQIVDRMTNTGNQFIIDPMPLEACKMNRSNRSIICTKEIETSPNHGYCASQQMNSYGYKLHAACSATGVFKHFELTPASVHDIHYLNDV